MSQIYMKYGGSSVNRLKPICKLDFCRNSCINQRVNTSLPQSIYSPDRSIYPYIHIYRPTDIYMYLYAYVCMSMRMSARVFVYIFVHIYRYTLEHNRVSEFKFIEKLYKKVTHTLLFNYHRKSILKPVYEEVMVVEHGSFLYL